jgi:hypothetical protein
MQLTIEQIRFFHLNGFLRIETPVATPDEIDWMCEAYDRMFAEKAGWKAGDQFDLAGTDEEGKSEALPQILNPAKYAPELNDGKFLVVVNDIVKQLLGDEAEVGIAHAIFKPSGHGAATPWHQDEAYWDPAFLYKAISVWMPLQPATIENGCLWFVPGSHEWDVLPHQSIGGDVRVHGLEMVNTEPCKTAVACPIPAGCITIHRNRTAHFAGPNTSDIPRRALILMGGLPQTDNPATRRFPWNDIKQTSRAERAEATQTS